MVHHRVLPHLIYLIMNIGFIARVTESYDDGWCIRILKYRGPDSYATKKDSQTVILGKTTASKDRRLANFGDLNFNPFFGFKNKKL